MSAVSRDMRHTRHNPCPVCGGAEQDVRGKGKRCTGFTSADGEWCHCSREELAGSIEQDNAQTFAHKMRGACRCGQTHNADVRPIKDEIVAVYDYADENGELLYQVVRKTPKRFVQRRPDGAGGWIWKLENTRRVLYRLPELLADNGKHPVFVVEGEKDADTITKLGYLATCNSGGAGKWSAVAESAQVVLGCHEVVVIADADEPGRAHAREIVASLQGIARSVRAVECAKGKDVTAHLAAGGTLDELVPLQAETQSKEPEQSSAAVDLIDSGTFPWTDSGNAERLIALCGRELRYVSTWHKWMFWTGRRWTVDEGAPHRAAKAVAREMMRQAQKIGDPDRRSAAIRYALRCESKKAIEAAVGLAKHDLEIAISHDALDANPWLLNCKNGTIDLKSGKLRDHRREDLLTKVAPVDFDPAATCDRFARFVSEIMAGDEACTLFLHRFLGYCLTGDVREHILAFWHGGGGNGKSLLALIVLAVMGDYAGKAAPDLLFKGDSTNRHPTEQADLHGLRLVLCNETTGGRSWDEGTVKDLTGGDVIRARRMREDFWEYTPTHKLVVFGNRKPRIRCVDTAIERRLRLVPFGVSFVGREDKDLSRALMGELSGVLRWLVEGCLAWQANGIPESKAVNDATRSYLRDEDTLGQFLNSECVFTTEAKVTRKEVRDRYVAWSEARGEHPVSAKNLAEALRKGGAVERKVKTGAGPRDGWTGLRLATAAEQTPQDEPAGSGVPSSEQAPVVTRSEQIQHWQPERSSGAVIRESLTTKSLLTTGEEQVEEPADDELSFADWLERQVQ